MSTFAQSLDVGRVAEGLIATWLMSRGCAVMPAYEVEIQRGKGPQMFSADAELILPDMLCFNHNGIHWIEAKHKSVFSWHRATRQWVTGIDLRHYVDYYRVSRRTRLPVWLLFFHRESQPAEIDLRFADCPRACPTGLFGGELFRLLATENHRAPHFDPCRTGFVGHGKSGMVYWAAGTLRLLATREEVIACERAKKIQEGCLATNNFIEADMMDRVAARRQ